MGSLIYPELGSDCRFPSKTCVQRTIGHFIAEVGRINGASEKILKLDDYVNRLQDEMKKIDAFKRELPLCMLLLSDAIFTIKEELDQCKKSNVEPVLEEFIPLKKSCTDQSCDNSKEKDISNKDKRNWMSSVQLWNSDNNNHHPDTDLSNNKSTVKLDNKKRKEEDIDRPMVDNLFQSGKNGTMGRAFVPFKGRAIGKEDGDELPVPGLSLCTPQIKNLHSREEIDSICFIPKSTGSKPVPSPATNVQSNSKAGQHQNVRKQRRCWSPDLHRRFVNALQQLGGPQVATPKQIRELMQVDGLTNDEVKSHLQKYRLHTRRVPTNTSTTQPAGLCMSQDQSGSPEGHLQLAKSSRGSSGDEDEDDEKSESHCCN
ncbi:hypothetical protein CDL12_13179 [Handroanthus impetiginosus]|uniref:HTH myb-type domain-containing protein n=1 Tax=Handroanthus impetiginosus TaxID=429701 RepID=A0A2G9H9I8_9LAMI|nr:hypothetical protein CDL12_13179 [Handroanthus impetiginosus]